MVITSKIAPNPRNPRSSIVLPFRNLLVSHFLFYPPGRNRPQSVTPPGRDFFLSPRPYNEGMQRFMLKSKLHRATVTHADVDYEGSLTLDRDLLEAADIVPFEQVHVWNVTRGTRLWTYAMEGERGSAVVCINGAAAHL